MTMRTTTIRSLLALAAFVFLIQWSKPAAADVTITGTVGEIGILPVTCIGTPNQNCVSNASLFRFKLTDATQTATCTDQANPRIGATTKYAYFLGLPSFGGGSVHVPVDYSYREWYSALLVSKKGAPIVCTLADASNCRVTSCTLP